MTIEEIRANAPSDATHYLKNRIFKVEFLFLYELIHGSWVMLSFNEYPESNLKPL